MGRSSNRGNARYAGNVFRVGVQSSIATAPVVERDERFLAIDTRSCPVPASLVSWMRIGREAVQPREHHISRRRIPGGWLSGRRKDAGVSDLLSEVRTNSGTKCFVDYWY